MTNTVDGAYKIGIDVGGTTIDFVVVERGGRLCYAHKVLINDTLEHCFSRGLNDLMTQFSLHPQHCFRIHLGTTLAVNSLLTERDLYRVGILRLAGQKPSLPPVLSFSPSQKRVMFAGYETVNGGRNYNHTEITPIHRSEIIQATKKLLHQGAESLGLVGVFSPLYPDEEETAQKIILEAVDATLPITVSHQFGGIDFIERENNVILNAALKKVIRQHFERLSDTLINLGFHCPLFVTQNNGTLITIQDAIHFPLKTISSGPTNSLVGACQLSGCRNAIVIDIGGTSTDIGVVENGFPRYAIEGGTVARIPLNFMLPDIHVLPYGGGSVIRSEQGIEQIMHESIGARIFKESISVGGHTLTLFDIGNRLKDFASYPTLSIIQEKHAKRLMQQVIDEIHQVVCCLQASSSTTLTCILVGGGSAMIPHALLREHYQRPNHYAVANAYGAALAEISATLDQVFYLDRNREQTLKTCEEEAKRRTVSAGADPQTVRIIDKQLLPFYYMPNQMTRVLMTAAGKIKEDAHHECY